MFEPLNETHFYSRHYYLFRYIVNPSVFSASVCIFYNVPWIPLLIMTAAICIDITLSYNKVLFKKEFDNKALLTENCLFLAISLLFVIFLSLGESAEHQSLLGWLCITVVIFALLSVVVFKCKGREVL